MESPLLRGIIQLFLKTLILIKGFMSRKTRPWTDLVDSTWWTRLGGPTYTTTFFRRHKSPPNQRMPSLLDVCRNLACAILVYNTTNSDLLTYHEKCTALHPMLDAAIEDWFFTSNSTYLNTALFFVCKRHVSNTTFFEF